MHVESFDHKISLTSIEVLVLDLTFGITVQCVSIVCTKLFYVEVRSTGTDLFIRCKSDADLSMRKSFFDDLFCHGKNLCDSRLVICPKKCGSVSCDQSSAL